MVAGPPAMVDVVSLLDDVVTTGVWVSLQTKEQFIAKASTLLERSGIISGAGGAVIPAGR